MTDELVPPPLGLGSKTNLSLHEQLLDNLFDGVYFVDRERRITYWNQGAAALTGYSPEQAVGHRCYDNFLNHINERGDALCFNGCPLSSTLQDGQRRECRVFLLHARGHRVPVNVRVAPIHDAAGQITGAVEIFTDCSAQLKIERQAAEFEHLALNDSLTGLPNRRFLELRIREALGQFDALGRPFGLLAIDADHFKTINDIHGHPVGDQVLQQTARTLRSSIRPQDHLGRWGGEEFLVLLAGACAETLGAVAERCRHAVSQAEVAGKHGAVRVTVSVGGTLFRCGDTVASVLQRADQLMYQSKAQGRNQSTCQ